MVPPFFVLLSGSFAPQASCATDSPLVVWRRRQSRLNFLSEKPTLRVGVPTYQFWADFMGGTDTDTDTSLLNPTRRPQPTNLRGCF